MTTGIKHLHSFLPYLFLGLLIISILVFIIKLASKKDFSPGDKKLALFTLILGHLQALIGIVLYILSPIIKNAFANSSEIMSNETFRFYVVEHALTMIIAVVLITIGYSKSKKVEDSKKFKLLTIFNSIALILILSRLPWSAWLGL